MRSCLEACFEACVGKSKNDGPKTPHLIKRRGSCRASSPGEITFHLPPYFVQASTSHISFPAMCLHRCLQLVDSGSAGALGAIVAVNFPPVTSIQYDIIAS